MSMAEMLLIVVIAMGILSFAHRHAADMPPNYSVYISGSKGKAGAIDLYRFNSATGALTKDRTVAELPDPNFLAFSPDHKFLYATSNPRDGAVVAFAVDIYTGSLTRINEQPSAGHRSVHVSIEPSGRTALVANYVGNTVAALGINADGTLSAPKPAAIQTQTGAGPNPSRQPHPFPHSIYPDPTGRFAYSCDLGTDQIYCYKLDAASAMLTPNTPPAVSTPPGSGPRHLAFSVDRKHAYVICEMGNILLVYDYDATTGALTQIQTISHPPRRHHPPRSANRCRGAATSQRKNSLRLQPRARTVPSQSIPWTPIPAALQQRTTRHAEDEDHAISPSNPPERGCSSVTNCQITWQFSALTTAPAN